MAHPSIAKKLEKKCDGSHRHIHPRSFIRSQCPLLYPMILEALNEENGAGGGTGGGGDRGEKDRGGEKEDERDRRLRQVIQGGMQGDSKERDCQMNALSSLIHHGNPKDLQRPVDLTAQTVDRHSRRSPGGKVCADLASFQSGGYWDNARGGWLDSELVAIARSDEMQYVRKHKVYTRVPLEQCWLETGRAPIKTGWADTNKGTGELPNIRSRWVAKEYKTNDRPDLFAATSPLEGVKLVLSQAASSDNKDQVVLIVDVRRAYFYARATRRVFIQLPEEDWEPGDEGRCGLLLQSLYGTRDAALNWERELEDFLAQELGLVKGKASTCLYACKHRGMSVAVHGDDCTFQARRRDAEEVLRRFQARYEIKSQMIGEDEDLSKEGAVLNRTLIWTRKGIEIEADTRHVKEVLKALDMLESNAVATPCVEEQRREEEDGEEQVLQGEEATRYRAVVARVNYLSQDRADIRYSTMRLCSRMSSPTPRDMEKLKRMARYLKGRPRMPALFAWQSRHSKIIAFTDNDWAGDKVTRRSVSGGVVMLGGHVLKTWAKSQSVIATSSAEAELYAAGRGGCEALGVQSYLQDLGWQRDVAIRIDSSATLCLLNRTGLGRAKHIEIQHLWLQEAVKLKRLSCAKVLGHDNPADLMTKALSFDRITYLAEMLGCRFA